MIQYQDPAALVGGLFLLWLAYKIALSARNPAAVKKTVAPQSLWGGFLVTFFLTITNPATILSFVAIFSGIGYLNTGGGGSSSILLVGGVFLGSALWWVVLAFLATDMQKRLGNRFTSLVNIASAVIIGLFGVFALASLLVP